MIKDIYLLVGGEATRLRPLSEGIPKALLTIKEEPLINIILDNLSDTNFDNINLICSIKHEAHWKQYQKIQNLTLNYILREKNLILQVI